MKRSYKLGSAVMTAVMALTLVPWISGGEDVSADPSLTKDDSNTCFGVDWIKNPSVPMNSTSSWLGNYIYWGHKGSSPLKFKVLDKASTKFSSGTGESVFISCDTVLYKDKVTQRKPDDKKWPYYDWTKSDCTMRTNLNARKYDYFTSDELQSLLQSNVKRYKYSEPKCDNDNIVYADEYTPLNNEDVFLLDIDDLFNSDYGFPSDPEAKQRVVCDESKTPYPYYLRSNYHDEYPETTGLNATRWYSYFEGVVIGKTGSIGKSYEDHFIVPAMNINSNNIIFSTLVGGVKGSDGASYKLTVADYKMFVDIAEDSEITLNGNELTIPYEIYGAEAAKVNRISLLVLKNDNLGKRDIVLYQPLSKFSDGVGKITVAQEILDNIENDPQHYKMYIVPECVNEMYETDYAGALRQIDPPTFDLAAIKNTQSSASDGKIKVTWNALDGAEKYEIWRQLVSDGFVGEWINYAETVETTANFNDPIGTSVDGITVTEVRFKVRGSAVKSGTSVYGPFGDITMPVKVKGVKVLASDSGSQVDISWDPVDGADDYVVYYISSKKIGRIQTKETYVAITKTKDTTALVNVDGKNITETTRYVVRARKTVDGTDCYGAYSNPVLARRNFVFDLTSKTFEMSAGHISAIETLVDIGVINRTSSEVEDVVTYKLDLDKDGTDDVSYIANTLMYNDKASVKKDLVIDASKRRGNLNTVTFKMPVEVPAPTPTATPTPGAKTTVTPTSAPKPTVKATVTPVPSSKVTATPVPGKVSTTPAPSIAAPSTTPPVDPKAQILAFVERIYTYVLDREPEAEGAKFWSDELYSFRRTGAEVGLGFIFSDEFVNRNLSDEDFVTVLYKTFFGRDSEEGGFKFWTDALKNGTMDRRAVANGFIFSQEWADTCARYGIRSGGDIAPSVSIDPTDATYAFVERMYTTAMKRASDKEGAKFWANELSNFRFTGEQVGVMFFLSEEMQNFNLDNKEFVTRLYKTFMDRDPEEGGFNFWVGYLADGGSREGAVLGFTRSEEFVNKCVEARILPY